MIEGYPFTCADDLGMDCLLVLDATAAAEQQLHDSTIAGICSEGGIFGAVATTYQILSAFT